jgi:hypothetical protein
VSRNDCKTLARVAAGAIARRRGRTSVARRSAKARGDALTLAEPIALRAHRVERRRFAFLAARARPGDERHFEASVESTGGVLLPADHGLLIAVYGTGGVERAGLHAARGALELRRASRLEGLARVHAAPATVVFRAETSPRADGTVELSPEIEQLADELLACADPGEIRVPHELTGELAREIRLRESGTELLVEGFRSRRERDERPSPLIARRELLRSLSVLLIEASRGKGGTVHLVGGRASASRALDVSPRPPRATRSLVHMRADRPTRIGARR